MYIIYRITCLMNQKIYIGQTMRSLQERYGSRITSHNREMQPDIDKYGSKNFIVEQIDECEESAEADKLECWYIHFYHSHISRFGYNLTDTGNGRGMTNRQHTEASKEKNRKAHLGRQHTEAAKQHLSILAKESWKTGKLKPHKSWSKGFTKETHPSVKKWADKQKGKVISEDAIEKSKGTRRETLDKMTLEERSDKFAWQKGLTKETSKSLQQQSDSVKKTFEEKKEKGEKIGRPKGISMTPEQIAKREATKRLKRLNKFNENKT